MVQPFQPDPAYTQSAYAEELRLARERVVYLTACLRQVQTEAAAEIARLTNENAGLQMRVDGLTEGNAS